MEAGQEVCKRLEIAVKSLRDTWAFTMCFEDEFGTKDCARPALEKSAEGGSISPMKNMGALDWQIEMNWTFIR